MNLKGFTLVEVMIVIMIIASISVLGFSSFINQKNKSDLLFSVEEIVSEINFYQSKVAFNSKNNSRYEKISDLLDEGENEIESFEIVSNCYEIKFEDDEMKVYLLDYSFDKVFDGEKWVFGGCELNSAEFLKSISFDRLNINTLSGDVILIAPPKGEITTEITKIYLGLDGLDDEKVLSFENNKFILNE